MPTYEYKCDACGERFEVVQRITEDPLTECRSCKGTIRRVIGAAGFVLKGRVVRDRLPVRVPQEGRGIGKARRDRGQEDGLGVAGKPQAARSRPKRDRADGMKTFRPPWTQTPA